MFVLTWSGVLVGAGLLVRSAGIQEVASWASSTDALAVSMEDVAPLVGLQLMQLGFLRGTFGGTATDPQEPDFFGSLPEVSDGKPDNTSYPVSGVRGPRWAQRSVNTSLTCQSSGCSAVASLQAYNPASERARNCKLSVFFHPTDFDDQYSGERVRFIKVNGATVRSDCFPMISGCNATATMFACARDVPVDGMIDSKGSLQVSATISEEVDECPYEGNLLSAVPMLSCLVSALREGRNGTRDFEAQDWAADNASDFDDELRSQRSPGDVDADDEGQDWASDKVWPALPVTPPPKPALPVVPVTERLPTRVDLTAVFRCPTRGCTATADFKLNTTMPISHCFLTVHVNQTDFDGSDEVIEFIKVNGAELATNLQPGSNPCQLKYLGKPAEQKDNIFTALKHEDVTPSMLQGNSSLQLQVKISNQVDECAKDGYLLSGVAQLRCALGFSDQQQDFLEQERIHSEALG